MDDKSLRALIVEKSEDETLLLVRTLKKGGYNPVYERVKTPDAMKKALEEKPWDIIFCDHKMPTFQGPQAIALLKEANVDIPLIVVSGVFDETMAVKCMRLNAEDYVLKTNFSRLCPVIATELEDAEVDKKQMQQEKKLRLEEKRFRAFVEYSSDIIVVMNLQGTITYINPAIEKVLGFKVAERIGHKGFELVHPDDIKSLSDNFKTLAQSTMPIIIQSEMRLRHKDGGWRMLEGIGSNLIHNNVVEAVIVNYRDITERKKAEETLQAQEQRFKSLAEQSADIILLINKEGMITYENPAVERILGLKIKDRIGRNAFENIRPSDLNRVHNAFTEFIGEKDAPSRQDEICVRSMDGSWHTFESVSRHLVMDNNIDEIIVNLREITDRKRAEEDLRESKQKYLELSIIDDLTRLYNSRHFYAQLEKEIERSNRYEQPLTILLLDLDDFKMFNDAHGHVEGDYVLSRLGEVIKRCLRETDSAYRYGGEEFTIILPMTTSGEGIVTAKRIQAELSKEVFCPAGQKVHLTVSTGLSQYRLKEEIKAFVHRVDRLMYDAKKKGKDRICSEP